MRTLPLNIRAIEINTNSPTLTRNVSGVRRLSVGGLVNLFGYERGEESEIDDEGNRISRS